MKKLIIGLIALGLTSLGFSQNNTNGISEVQLKSVVITVPNIGYLNDVSDGSISSSVGNLQLEAANFNIKDLKEYNSDLEFMQVAFYQKNGKIIANYDKSGNIIRSTERFKNVVLPPAVRSSIYKDHMGWDLKKDTYQVSYRPGKEVKKVYKVQLKKGNLKKNLKLDSDGRHIKMS